jgi:hypothetical protein
LYNVKQYSGRTKSTYRLQLTVINEILPLACSLVWQYNQSRIYITCDCKKQGDDAKADIRSGTFNAVEICASGTYAQNFTTILCKYKRIVLVRFNIGRGLGKKVRKFK